MSIEDKTIATLEALAKIPQYSYTLPELECAIQALREKQERENIIRDIKADMKPDDTYSVALVLELLGDKPAHGPCFPGQSAHGGDGHA